MTEPQWVPKPVASAMHLRQLAEHGGAAGVRDEGLLDSALQRPRDKFAYGAPDLCELAAAYAFGIARNHPFIDGNKRTALVVSFTFLLRNGLQVTAAKIDVLSRFLALADGSLDEAELADWFRQNTGPPRQRGFG